MTSIKDGSLEGRIDIRLLSTPPELAEASDVLMQIWGSTTPIVSREMLRAVEHSGGYISGAYDGSRLIGVSFGWRAQYHGDRALHSHVTGLLAGTRHSGLGRSLKFHQREWARTHDIKWITWNIFSIFPHPSIIFWIVNITSFNCPSSPRECCMTFNAIHLIASVALIN